MHNRRTRRTPSVVGAIRHYLEALCLKRGMEAASLTTDDGLMIAGAGHLDVEWMGALGASTSRRSFEFESRTMHVNRFVVNGVSLCLTTAGAPIRDDSALGSLRRIIETPSVLATA